MDGCDAKRTIRRGSAVWGLLVAIACCADEPGDGLDGSACDAIDQRPPAQSTEPEAASGYEDRLAQADVSTLADPIDTSQLTDLERAWLAYALVLTPDSLMQSLPRAAIPDTDLGHAIEASLALGSAGRLDFDLLRQAVHRLYPCDRDIPRNRDAFVQRYGDYTTFASRTIEMSVPKLAPRTLYENEAAGVFVAQTQLADGGLELEVILAGARADGALEFFGYGPDGDLLGWADLAVTGTLAPFPVPYSCALCHRDLTANSFSVVDPS